MTQTLFSRVPVDQPCKETEGQGTAGVPKTLALKKEQLASIILIVADRISKYF